MLIHLVDGTLDDIAGAWRTVRNELGSYDPRLLERPELLCLNKADALVEEVAQARSEALAEAAGRPVFITSGVSRLGHQAVLGAAWGAIRAARAKVPA